MTFGSPAVNAASHLRVFVAQQLMYDTVSKIKLDTAGAKSPEQVRTALSEASVALQATLKKVEGVTGSALADKPLQTELENGISDMTQALHEYFRTKTVEDIQFKGQNWQNWISRCVRTVANGVASLYGTVTGDSRTSFWIQMGAMLATQASGQHASMRDANNKLTQQYIAMMECISVLKPEAEHLAPAKLTVEHLAPEKMVSQLQGPLAARLDLAKEMYGYEKSWLEQDLAKLEFGLSRIQYLQLTQLRAIDPGEINEADAAKLTQLQAQVARHQVAARDQTRIDGLKQAIASIDKDIKRLKQPAQWAEIDPARQELLRSLMVSAEESGLVSAEEARSIACYPYNPFASPTEGTETAKLAWAIGSARGDQPQEMEPMYVQKYATSFQMVAGGSSFPQLVSAVLRVVTTQLRKAQDDPGYNLPMGLRVAIGSLNIMIGGLAAFSAAPLINVKGEHRSQLRSDLATGKRDIPVGAHNFLLNAEFLKMVAGHMGEAMFGVPTSAVGAMRLDKAKQGADAILKNARAKANEVNEALRLEHTSDIASSTHPSLINLDETPPEHRNGEYELQSIKPPSLASRTSFQSTLNKIPEEPNEHPSIAHASSPISPSTRGE